MLAVGYLVPGSLSGLVKKQIFRVVSNPSGGIESVPVQKHMISSKLMLTLPAGKKQKTFGRNNNVESIIFNHISSLDITILEKYIYAVKHMSNYRK